jgi:hypothetical protein
MDFEVENEWRKELPCNSSVFFPLGGGVEDFADYFANVPVSFVQLPSASECVDDLSFRHMDLVECFQLLMASLLISNALGVCADGISD